MALSASLHVCMHVGDVIVRPLVDAGMLNRKFILFFVAFVCIIQSYFCLTLCLCLCLRLGVRASPCVFSPGNRKVVGTYTFDAFSFQDMVFSIFQNIAPVSC